MKLEEKINDRKVAFLFRKNLAIAFELGLLYYILAKRKNARDRLIDSCLKSVKWLKIAGIDFPEYFQKLSVYGQLEEIEKALVLYKSRFFGWDVAKVGAREDLEELYTEAICKD